MTPALQSLLAEVKGYRMTKEERIEQEISFAYGNLRLEEHHVPRALVEAAVRRNHDDAERK